MNREEILSSNPLIEWISSKGIELSSNNTRSKRCPLKEHTRKDAVHITGNLWDCKVCGIGGTVIDWLMHEKGISAKEAMEQLSNEPNKTAPQSSYKADASPKVIATYPYVSADGKTLYEVQRLDPKSFRQRRPDGKGGWTYQTSGIQRVLYRLPDVLKSQEVWIVEGEKDADNLIQIGIPATSADGGAGNFRCDTAPLNGKDVVLCGDNDDAGEKHIQDVADKLNGVCRSVRRIRVPAPHKDISDYIADVGDPGVAAEACRCLLMEADVIHGPLLRSLCDIQKPDADDPDELIQYRYLCRGGMMLFVAPSGIGKSSFVMQCAIQWTLGRECFGMKPKRPLKVVLVQAENDDGDMVEMRDGVLSGMELEDGEIELVLQMIQFRTEFSTSGPKFAKLINRILEESKADIIIIDPVLAYLGGDMNAQETVGAWLRNHLMPVLKIRKSAAILVHHTNKPPSGKEKPDWKAGELSYLGGGSAEWVNACRSVMCIQSIGSHDIYKMVAAKRGGRLGWRDGAGELTRERYIAHSNKPGVICWRELTAEEAAALGADVPKKGPKMDEYLSIFPVEWKKSARQALLNASELRLVFKARGWDYRTETVLRQDALVSGSLAKTKGDGSEILIGRPEVVREYVGE